MRPEARNINWSLDLLASPSVASQAAIRQGYVGLRFAFHPGTIEASTHPVFTLYIDALSVDLARTSHEYQLDFERREWQVVEIPFEVFAQTNHYGTGLRDQIDVINSIRIEGNLTGTFYLDDVRLRAATSLSILDDALAAGWDLVGAQGAQPLGLTENSAAFNGAKAAAVTVKPETRNINWSLDLVASPSVASQSVARQGFVGLRFAFHPGTVEASARPVFTLYIDALGVDLARTSHEYQLDFGRREWQVVEIPFEVFEQFNYYYGTEPLAQVEVIDSIRIEGNLTGVFYLDDVRLVTGTPQAATRPVKTSVEANSWGRVKALFHR